MSVIRVGVVNQSGLAGDNVDGGIAALREQLERDFRPVWGIDAHLFAAPSLDKLEAGAWGLVLCDGPAGGTITPLGMPGAAVDVDQPGRVDWTHAASHRLLEMLANPMIAGSVYHESDDAYRLFAREVCDPCASPAAGYERAGRLVSDFVFPRWFGGEQEGCLDQTGAIGAPFTVGRAGYAIILDLGTWLWSVLRDDGQIHPLPDDIDGRAMALVDSLYRGKKQQDQWGGPVQVIGPKPPRH